uniref:Translocon at the inner envelope membrane of chloroplasts 214 n=1 Tax=Zapoteca portoricensis TaxID=1465380 RepID=A0A6H0EHQ8_9FABA|nr:hypothetical protein RF1 [Zapoteca portoricensis]YP_009770317.1 hypothetical protein RF1 [Zapoteca portoricensis]QIT00999.1 hypothetical protein RF1 [Zapoteca portoricensis]QIT01019.1 hypothetical protein RF1 [Zapoteca portoricensis]
MITLKSFLPPNLVSLCMKIMNSVVVVGLYYGFLTTFSIGPSYLLLLRARVLEEETEKKVSATTGFITGQLMMFISIYYAPLHLAFCRPHAITFIALPYLLFYFFCNNHKDFFNYESTNSNSMRNFSTQGIFLSNLIFPLLNLFILPSSMLVRLVNIYMFRCNNQFLFLTSSFVGWLIGHILFLKWVGLVLVWIQKLVLVWIQKNNSIQPNVRIRFYKYIMLELTYWMSRIFIIFLFISSIYYLGRTPTWIKNQKMSEIEKSDEIDKEEEIVDKEEEIVDKEEEIGVEIFSETELINSLFSPERENSYKIDEREEKEIDEREEKEIDGREAKGIFQLEKPLLRMIFDYKRFHRPLRYIKNDQFENAVRNEMSQFFFHTSQSDGKERLSFSYPTSLSTFLEMMQRKISLFTTEKLSYDELDNRWSSINEQKRNNLSNQFLNRAEALDLDKEFLALDVLEKRIRLCNDETKKYLPKIYDPFLNGPSRGRIKKSFLFSIKNKTYTKNYILINKIHAILLNINTDYPDFEQKIDRFEKKSLSNEIRFFFNLISQFSGKSVSNFKGLSLFREHEKMDSEANQKKMQILFDAILTDENDKTIINRKEWIGIKESSKKVPRWSYKFIDEVEYLESEGKRQDFEICSRKPKYVVIYTENAESADASTDRKNTGNSDDEKEEFALTEYLPQTDFNRDILKGSKRAQRRKTVIWKIYQASPHSPLFFDKIDNSFFFSFLEIFELWKKKNTELTISDYTDTEREEEKLNRYKEKMASEIKQGEEINRMLVSEAWENNIQFGQAIRGFLLIAQSIIRKYIRLPLLIITKNIVRILLFQSPEWSEDFKEWNKEMHIFCTNTGVPLSETEFPQNWLTEGIQIKVLFPFCLKPWHRSRSKLRSPQKEKDPMKKKKKVKKWNSDFFFFTVFGTEVESPYSSHLRKQNRRSSFFAPIFKALKKEIKIRKKKSFLVLKVLNERTKSFLNITKEEQVLSGLRKIKIDELNKIQKDSTKSKSNPMIYESTIPIQSINWTDCSLTEKKIKDLNDRTKKIIRQIEEFKKDEKKGSERNIWQILQKGNIRLSRTHSFLRFFIETVYIDIFLCITNINIPKIKINVQLFLESTKKILNKYIYNNEANEERKRSGSDKKNQSLIHFISTIKKSTCNIRNTNSQNFCDVSSLSQAYVFFKLAQTQVINLDKYKLRSLFEYHGTPLFLKNEIKDSFFGVQGISHSKLKHKSAPNSVMNQWTNWLKGHYQYDLSRNGWSRLVSQKWRNKMNERHVAQNKDLTKYHSYEKNGLILYKKQEIDSLTNKKKKRKKQYGYDLLSYKSINYADKKDSYIYGYRSSFQANNNHMTDDISIKNYRVEDLDMKKNLDRKCFDWRILNSCFRNKMHFGGSIDIDYFFMLHREIKPYNKKNLFDWMGMNVEILNRFRVNQKSFLFSKNLIFDNAYMSNPWIMPIKFLFLNLNVNQNGSEKKKITEKNKKEYLEFELETRNKGKTEYASQLNLEASLSKKEKDVKEDSAESDIKKGKDGYTNNIEAELNCFPRGDLLFQLNCSKDSLNEIIMDNIHVYSLLLRLQKNIRDVVITSIQRGELSLDILKMKNQKDFTLTELNRNMEMEVELELIKEGIVSIEPIRLSRRNHEQFNMYQIIGLSFIHKRKPQIDKKNLDKSIKKSITRTRDQKLTENKEKKNYDLLVPENILSARRRRELRILICFNPKNRNSVHRNKAFYNENKVNNCCQVLATSKDLDRDKKKLINLKLFLWPNYRLEDLACMNRYWFDTNNGSRFSMVRIRMYPRLKIS